MFKLEPIKDIPVDFGKPTDFSPPSMHDLIRGFIEEAHEVEDHEGDGNFNAHEFGRKVWMASLTAKERAEYDVLVKAENSAEHNYHPRTDPDTSEAARAYFAASDARELFERTHGQHICFDCTYYTCPLKSNECAACFKLKKAIRPYTLSCEHYTNNRTPEDEAIDEKERIWMAQHPHEARLIATDRKRESAERTAQRINSDNSVVFFSYDAWPDEIEEKYRKYPDIFAKTKYPTFEEFKAAADKFLSKFRTQEETTTPTTTPEN